MAGPHQRSGGTSVVLAIILFTGLIFFMQLNAADRVTGLLGMNSLLVRDGEVWRLLSYVLVHDTGIFHILFNMYLLFLFGSMVEAQVGPARFTLLYVVAGLFGSMAWLLFNFDHPGWMIGASGSVMGVLTVAAALYPEQRIMLLIPPIPMKLRTMVICIIILETFLEFSRSNTGIAHLAHLGGIAGGIVCYLLFLRKGRPSQQQSKRAIEFKRRMSEVQKRSVHTCEVCGATEETHPNLSFRVCSQCTGAKEYCEEHLRTHDHH